MSSFGLASGCTMEHLSVPYTFGLIVQGTDSTSKDITDHVIPECPLVFSTGVRGFKSSRTSGVGLHRCIICSYLDQNKPAFWVGMERMNPALDNNEGQ